MHTHRSTARRPGVSAWAALAALALAGGLTACDDDAAGEDLPGTEPVFAEDFEQTYTEVRGCRQSPEHQLTFIRLFVPADQAALIAGCMAPGATCTEALPKGTVLVKPEYVDADCNELLTITASRRETDGPAGDRAAWRWQNVSPEGVVKKRSPRPGEIHKQIRHIRDQG
jgi:hypothetical protein